MIQVQLIRHGETKGNGMKRYIGITDEPLSTAGRDALIHKNYRKPDMLISSPLLRCAQTCELLFPEVKPIFVKELRECDFGLFENKNYKELRDSKEYQAWIDSNGQLPFPEGESKEDVRNRVQKGFETILELIQKSVYLTQNEALITLVVHGGTIMHLMEELAEDSKQQSFYDWQIENGCGYSADLIFEEANKVRLCHIQKIKGE